MPAQSMLAALASIMSLLALARWPYAYYQFLRWLVCAAALVAVFSLPGRWRIAGVLILVPLAIIFNPLVPFRMERESWAVFNILAASALGGAAVVLAWPRKAATLTTLQPHGPGVHPEEPQQDPAPAADPMSPLRQAAMREAAETIRVLREKQGQDRGSA